MKIFNIKVKFFNTGKVKNFEKMAVRFPKLYYSGNLLIFQFGKFKKCLCLSDLGNDQIFETIQFEKINEFSKFYNSENKEIKKILQFEKL